MRKLTLLYFLFIALGLKAQKPVIDTGKFREMFLLTSYQSQISDNGRYVSYLVTGLPSYKKWTLMVKSVESHRELGFVDAVDPCFSPNSKNFACLLPEKKLVTVRLKDWKKNEFSSVRKFIFFSKGKHDWIAYLHDSTECMTLLDLDEGKALDIRNVYDFLVDGRRRMLYSVVKIDSLSYAIDNMDLVTGDVKRIYQGRKPIDLIVDKIGCQIAFLTEDLSVERNAWYYDHNKMSRCIQVKMHYMVDDAATLVNLDRFSDKGDLVFCRVDKRSSSSESVVKPSATVNFRLWSYADTRLRSQFPIDQSAFFSVWNIADSSVRQIQKRDESEPTKFGGNYLLIDRITSHNGEWNWNEHAIPSRVLVNIYTGVRKYIVDTVDRNGGSYVLSPGGKWVVYFDAALQSYFGYNTTTSVKRNLTESLVANWTDYEEDDFPIAKYRNIPIAGFDEKNDLLYLYDQNDIYAVDLTGFKKPVNLTSGCGKKENIVFRFAFPPEEWKITDGKILLSAFNRTTKEDGFFEVQKGGVHELKKLIMENAAINGIPDTRYSFRNSPLKAKNADVYLVEIMKANSAPNIYITENFKYFKALSDIHPEKKYNWLTSELVGYVTRDGRESQGILYKPENFDSTKRYPIIFYYYEKISDCLNMYMPAEFSVGPINIPFFVSNGYLVFTPDIHFQIGFPGRSSLNSVMGAADKLVRFPYVDSTKMALQGHSFGGFQTNYIITHTSRFAAACSAAGFTNFISAYGSIIGSGYSRQGQYELYRDRIGASLWERPDLYLENSPVLRIDKVNTPLLMMHNVEDDDVPVGQAVEFFTGMRRLGKVAYLLQYNGYRHIVINEAATDYSQRMLDFFNYYLRGYRRPDWMSDGRIKILDFKLQLPLPAVNKDAPFIGE